MLKRISGLASLSGRDGCFIKDIKIYKRIYKHRLKHTRVKRKRGTQKKEDSLRVCWRWYVLFKGESGK